MALNQALPEIIITRFPYKSQLGGEEIHTLNVAKHFRKIGYNVSFLTSCRVLKKMAKENKFDLAGFWFYKPPVTLFTLLIFTLLSPIQLLRSFVLIGLLKLSRKNFTFYMLSFGEKLLFTPWCILFKIPCIWVEHARIGNWFKKNPWTILYKKLAKNHLVKVVTVSEMMKNDLGISKTIVIKNAIETKDFKKLHDAHILPEKLMSYLRAHKFDVGYVGRLTEDKGMKLLIEAKKKMPEIGFTTIGSGPFKRELEKNGIYNYTSLNRDQIAAFMQNIDLFVLPASKKDPFGLVVLEAMASGAPVILTDLCGVSDYLKSGHNCIITTESKFLEDISNAISNEDLREKIATNATLTLDDFKFEDMLKAYGELL